jgi:predicted TIM-barrel fold metal-dependent hydrolase
MISDRYAVRNRDLIGVDKIMWEADFPHNDSNWPNSRKILAAALADVPDDEAQRIADWNARELYRFPRS